MFHDYRSSRISPIPDGRLVDLCRDIRLLVLDVDGVLCDGRAWQDARGRFRRCFSVRDALALRRWRKAGLKIAVITQVSSDDVRHEVGRMDVDFFIENCEDKAVALNWIKRSEGISSSQVALFSADPRDVLFFQDVSIGITSPGTSDTVKRVASFVTRVDAGDGAVAEACGMIMRAKSHARRLDGLGRVGESNR